MTKIDNIAYSLDNYFVSEAELKLNYSTMPSSEIRDKIDILIGPYNKEKVTQK
jgi:hypothetical protein